jgi:hypothetical protein
MSSPNSHVCIKYAGNLLKVQKAPYETEEKAHDRAWYIGKKLMVNNNNCDNNNSWIEKNSLSHIWANEKYLSMKYK